MGANAQTAVPVFTAGQVLTAAQVTQINTGIPVFATTVTRDAAFSGSGEKVLAQGQTCYIEATSSYQTYNGSAWVAFGAAGLTLIKTQTIGTAVASVSVTDAFSATYENYKIIVNGGTASGSVTMNLALGATTTGYYFGAYGYTYAGALIQGNQANAASWEAGTAWPNGVNANIEILSPQLAARTVYQAQLVRPGTTAGVFTTAGFLDNATQYTAFTLSPASGTITGGTIRVYGYANS